MCIRDRYYDRYGKGSVQRIDYPHIKPQITFPIAKAKIVKLDLKKENSKIGYLIGSGDEVALNLSQIGYDVESFKATELASLNLSIYDVIIVGIRAYNTEESMKNGNKVLNDFVKDGGNVIVQYNTSRGIAKGAIGPYPFQLSRKRVTKEEAKPTFLAPKHALLNIPNKLTEKDFDNWVQERGLYFPNEWDKEKYDAILSWQDKDEPAKDGSLLVTKFGKGYYVYTGISFFRELPAAVPGAYRLFVNLISLGNE